MIFLKKETSTKVSINEAAGVQFSITLSVASGQVWDGVEVCCHLHFFFLYVLDHQLNLKFKKLLSWKHSIVVFSNEQVVYRALIAEKTAKHCTLYQPS